jgi:hypothetical protein
MDRQSWIVWQNQHRNIVVKGFYEVKNNGIRVAKFYEIPGINVIQGCPIFLASLRYEGSINCA